MNNDKIPRPTLVQRLRAIDLNTPQATARACLVVPLLFGLWSVWLGQDRNWDLFNYHLYSAFAWLNGKLGIDLAPAGMQSYFNPVLDVFYYALYKALPAPLVGFILGALHGLNFVLLIRIAQSVLPDLADEDRHRVPLLLAGAGVLTANFLSELGNAMGDNLTALFCLLSLSIVLRNRERLTAWSTGAAVAALLAGISMGFAVGLKLTNAVYAVALCVSLLLVPSGVLARVRLAFVVGVGVLFGFALTGGYWLWKMWITFGNPFFPQFSAIFPNPLTASVGVVDKSWLPKSVVETILWPFIFSLDPKRVGQVTLHQTIWVVSYVLFWGWAALALVRIFTRRADGRGLSVGAAWVVAFVALGYLLWMKMFSIYRYIVPIELLAPLFVFILLRQLVPYRVARRVAAWVLGLGAFIVVVGGVQTWGHERWANPPFRADLPALEAPQKATAIIVGGDPAWGWLVTLFPASVAFTQIDGNFPATPRYDEHIRAMIRARGGPVYALFQARFNWRVDNVASMNRLADRVGLTASQRGCGFMQMAIASLRLHASVHRQPADAAGRLCRLGLRADDVRDIDAENARLVEQAKPVLERDGFTIVPNSCGVFRAYVGRGVYPYHWCRVSPN